MKAAVSWTAAVLVALVLAGCGGGGHAGTVTVNSGGASASTAGSGAAAAGSGTATITTSAATGTQATATTIAPTPGLKHVQAVLSREAAALGSHVGVAVEDLTTGQMLFQRGLALAQPPASLEKLYTAAATLWLMGPNARLHTQVYGSGYLFAGVWHGNLYVKGDGDPTFGDGGWNRIYEDGYGPTGAELIADLRRVGIKRVDGLIYADPSRFDSAEGGPATDDKPDPGDYGGRMSALVYDHGYITGKLGPAATAVHEVALTARMSGFHLVASTKLATTPADAKLLVTLSSPTMRTMLSLMLVPSDDLFADLFAKQLGYLYYKQGTLTLGALAIRQTIAQHYGLSPTIFDGSGLDKSDRSTPEQLLTLLARMHGTSVGKVVRADMAVVGKTGTVSGIGVGTRAAGRCQAKTGTLNYVTNLAGYCTARNGHTLAFVFMVDGPDNIQSVVAFTPMVGAVAGY